MSMPKITRAGAYSPAWAWVAVLALATGSFTLACASLSRDPRESITGPMDGRSVGEQLFGSGRAAIGGHFYRQADNYFHNGMEHVTHEAFHAHPFQRLGAAITPNDHVHLSGERVREIMPWLWMALRMDPANEELYLVSAYWLSGGQNHPEAALEVLREGQWNLPFNHAIQLALGRLYLRMGKPAEAYGAFRAGLAFWPGGRNPDDEAVRLDHVALLMYLAFLEEAEGRIPDAIRHFRELAALSPSQATMAERADHLEAGQTPDVPASEVLARLVHQDEHRHGPPRSHEDPETEDEIHEDRDAGHG